MKGLFDRVGLCIVAAGCTQRCRHCSASASEAEPELLTLGQTKAVVNALRQENEKTPPLYEHVSPGLLYEPMDHPDIVEIQRLFYELEPEAALVRTMATNGHRIATSPNWRELVAGLQRWGVERFQLTLHGLEEHHDWFTRRRGSYGEVMEAVRRLAAASARVLWVYFLDRLNVAELPQAMRAVREAARGTDVEESINVWGPAGRAAQAEDLLPRALDLELLPEDIRRMEMLSQYLPERQWVRLARLGKMQQMHDDFMAEVRQKGGTRPYNLRVDRGNVERIAELLAEARQQALKRGRKQEPQTVDLARLAASHGNEQGNGLYRVSTMRHEWQRRGREQGNSPSGRS